MRSAEDVPDGLAAQNHKILEPLYGSFQEIQQTSPPTLVILPYGVAPAMKGLTDISGISVGHASDFDALKGCTAILCEKGAVAGVDVRGSASETVGLTLLDPMDVIDRINAVVFAGGSAFG